MAVVNSSLERHVFSWAKLVKYVTLGFRCYGFIQLSPTASTTASRTTTNISIDLELCPYQSLPRYSQPPQGERNVVHCGIVVTGADGRRFPCNVTLTASVEGNRLPSPLAPT